MSKREGENLLLANERGQREKERERELLTKSFMLHLVSYKINTAILANTLKQ